MQLPCFANEKLRQEVGLVSSGATTQAPALLRVGSPLGHVASFGSACSTPSPPSEGPLGACYMRSGRWVVQRGRAATASLDVHPRQRQEQTLSQHRIVPVPTVWGGEDSADVSMAPVPTSNKQVCLSDVKSALPVFLLE